QAPAMWQRAGLKPGEPLVEMKLVAKDGAVFGGVDAMLRIARGIWWAWPLYALSFLPGAKTVLRHAYGMVAERRNCAAGACACPRKFFIADWIPLFLLIGAALAFLAYEPAWIATWGLVVALVWGFKWPLWRRARRQFGAVGFERFAGFMCWPGMEADVFF